MCAFVRSERQLCASLGAEHASKTEISWFLACARKKSLKGILCVVEYHLDQYKPGNSNGTNQSVLQG
jgi:hypothetical protein